MIKTVNGLIGLLSCSVLFAIAGCTGVGVHTPQDDGPSTAEFRYEVELIPNSELVRDNTSPDWQLGRYTFRRGADRLFVVSRFTSSLERLTEEQLKKGKVPQRYEWKLERVWITLPLGTPVGDVLMLEELERSFLVGYDEGELEDNAYKMYRQPNKVLGRLRVLEEKPDSITVNLNMRVEPKRSPSWDFRNETLTVPVAVSGIHAKPTEAALKPVSYESLLTGINEAQVTSYDEHSSEQLDSPLDQPHESENPNADEAERSVIGKWEMHVGDWEHRIQFDANGRFIHSATRGIAPMVRKGHYTIRSGFIVMTYEIYYQQAPDGSPGLDHMKFIKKKIVAIRPEWVGNDLILHAGLQNVQGKGSPPYRLVQGTYTDMNVVPMPKQKRPKFQGTARQRR